MGVLVGTDIHKWGLDQALNPSSVNLTVVGEDKRPIAGAFVRVQNGRNGDWNHFESLGKARTDEKGRFEGHE